MSPRRVRPLASIFHTVDELIRQGRAHEARERYLDAVKGGVLRAEVAGAGSLALRLGLYETGIRLLHPIVRPPPRRVDDATVAERAEYAHLLIKLGAIDEGLGLLGALDEGDYPRVLAYKVSALVAQWDYAGSIPLLTRYVGLRDLDPYDRLVGKVNLAAALVYEGRKVRATALLRELLHETSLRGYQFALGRVMEISAQHFIAQRRWDEAEALLEQARRRLGETLTLESLYVRKFRALVDYLRAGDGSHSRALDDVRAESIRRRDWETARDCDRATALVTKDERLLAKLWFGTPYPSYREKLARAFGATGAAIPESYAWNPRGEGKPRATLDLLTGRVDGKSIGLTPGSVRQRMLVALSSDFYRPLRIATLHAALYPGQFYHPERSPALLHDVYYRLRLIFDERRVPLAIEEADGFYRLTATKPCAVLVRAGHAVGQRHGEELAELRARFPRPFALHEALKAVPLARRTLSRVLQDAIARGELARTGKARAVRYVFKK